MLLPQREEAASAVRNLTAEDLAGLRDIGQPSERVDLESPLALSPDGRWVAFVLRRAVPETNGYCQGLVLMEVRAS